MSGSLQLPYAVRAGVVVSISEVESGLRRDCVCPVCGHALVAKKGTKVRHHFAHHRDSECEHAAETLLHLAAKQVIEQARQLMLPAVLLDFAGGTTWEISAAQMMRVEEVRIESPIAGLVPDLVVQVGERQLAIEVTVTHKTSEEKVSRLRKEGCSVLEIDLSGRPRFLSLDELKLVVIDGIEGKRWRYNRVAEAVRADVLLRSERKPTISRGLALHVDSCPIPARVWRGKPYANVIDDCWSCEYCVRSDSSDSGGTVAVLCIGRTGVKTYAQWKEYRHTAIGR